MTQYDLAEVADLYGLPEQVEEVLEPGPASALAVNPWGTLLAIGRPDGGVTIFDLQTRGLAATWPSSSSSSAAGGSRVTALLWSASGRTLLSGAADGSVTAWDVLAGRPEHRWGPLDGSAVVRLAWAGEQQRQEAKGGLVLVSMATAPAHLLCLASGQAQPLPVLNLGGDASSSSGASAAAAGQVAVASPDGEVVYAGGRGLLMVLRRTDLALLDACRVGKGPQVLDLQLHDRRLLVITADNTARVYLAYRPGEPRASRRQARQAAAAQQAQQQAAAAHQAAPAEWQTHAPSEAEAAARAAKQRTANSLFYDDSAAWLALHFTLTNTLEKQPLRCAALSPDGEYFAASHEGVGRQELYLWECDAEARLNAALEGPKDEPTALCWHPSHTPKQLLVLGQSGKVYIWAKAFIEKWSAFAPDFKELSSNDEYHELEDEFDLNPRAEEAAGPAAEEEEGEVDIGSGGSSSSSQQQAPANALPGPPLLHLPLLLDSREPAAAAGKPAGRQRQQEQEQQGCDGQQQRMDIG